MVFLAPRNDVFWGVRNLTFLSAILRVKLVGIFWPKTELRLTPYLQTTFSSLMVCDFFAWLVASYDVVDHGRHRTFFDFISFLFVFFFVFLFLPRTRRSCTKEVKVASNL